MFGGYDGKPLGGMYCFDMSNDAKHYASHLMFTELKTSLASQTWIKSKGNSNEPLARCRHNMIQLDSKRLLLVGGFEDAVVSRI